MTAALAIVGLVLTLGCAWAGHSLSQFGFILTQLSDAVKSLDTRVGNVERALIEKALAAPK